MCKRRLQTGAGGELREIDDDILICFDILTDELAHNSTAITLTYRVQKEDRRGVFRHGFHKSIVAWEGPCGLHMMYVNSSNGTG